MWLSIGAGAFVTICVLAAYDALAKSSTPSLTSSIVTFAFSMAIFLCACFIGIGGVYDDRGQFRDVRLLERYENLADKQGQLLGEDQLRLGELWGLSEERLRVYHEIATRQAKSSFRNAQWAIVAGFVVIIVGSCAVFLAKDATTAIVVGALGAIGAALSAYIGRTFLRLQETAADHLRSYFDQPREQFRYLAVERLLRHLESDEKKATAISELIRSIAFGSEQGTNAERQPRKLAVPRAAGVRALARVGGATHPRTRGGRSARRICAVP